MAHRYKFKNKLLIASIKDEIRDIACTLCDEITHNPVGFLDRKYVVTFYDNKNSIIPFYSESSENKIQKNEELKTFRFIKIGKFQLEDLAMEYYDIPYSRVYGKYNRTYDISDYDEMKEIYKLLLKLTTVSNDDIRKYFGDD